MSLLTCCLWWFLLGLLLGLLLGWLLNWLLSRMLRKEPPAAPRVGTDTAAARFATPVAPTPYTVAAPAPASPRASAIPPPRVVDVGAARAAGFNLKHADDLTIMEGIGPKIDELFRANGVSSFAQVSRLGIGEMQAILDNGGPHFKLANPGSWAQQALLASENRWSELKRLQDELISGIGPPGNR